MAGGAQPPPLPSIASQNASGPQPIPAPRETPPSLPRKSANLSSLASSERPRKRGRAERRTAGHAGRCGPNVSCSHILPERGRPDRQLGLRFPVALSVCFCSKKKKNPIRPPFFTLHTHSHTPTADTHTPGRRKESRVSPSRSAASPVLDPQQSGKTEAGVVTSDPVVMQSRRIP